MPNAVATPDLWLDRAQEARELARQLKDPDSQRSLLDIAAAYERIAQRARERRAHFEEAVQILEKNPSAGKAG